MAEEKKGFFKRLVSGLTKTRDNIVAGFDSIFSGFSSIDDDFYEELEEILIMGDIGINATTSILEHLKEQVAEQQVECIVIVARTNSTKIIARRIGRFCQEHAIALYDIHGRDLLLDKDEPMVEHPYFSMSMELVQQEILSQISFKPKE